MNDNSTNADQTAESWAAFQKIWGDTFAKMMQAGFTFSPETAPPDLMRQIRAGIFQALAQSWDQFLRSPQFLESTRQWMDNAIAFRKMSIDFLTQARHETQGGAREDFDNVMLSVRHMETRLLDRMEQIANQVKELNARLDGLAQADGAATPAAGAKGSRKTPRRQRGRRP